MEITRNFREKLGGTLGRSIAVNLSIPRTLYGDDVGWRINNERFVGRDAKDREDAFVRNNLGLIFVENPFLAEKILDYHKRCPSKTTIAVLAVGEDINGHKNYLVVGVWKNENNETEARAFIPALYCTSNAGYNARQAIKGMTGMLLSQTDIRYKKLKEQADKETQKLQESTILLIDTGEDYRSVMSSNAYSYYPNYGWVNYLALAAREDISGENVFDITADLLRMYQRTRRT